MAATQAQEKMIPSSKQRWREPKNLLPKCSGRTASSFQVLLLPPITNAALFLFPPFYISLLFAAHLLSVPAFRHSFLFAQLTSAAAALKTGGQK